MNAFPIGTSAIAVGQKALDVIGQNIANATTPGYHRQGLNLTERATGKVGTGVDVASITRFTAAPLRTAIISGNANQGFFTAQLDTHRQVETAFASGQGGISDRLEGFFNQVEELTGRPDSLASRRAIVTASSDLAAQFNSTAGDIDRLRVDLGQRAIAVVGEVNELATRIAELNNRIAVTEVGGTSANELRDQRDRLIDDLSQRIDIKTVTTRSGEINIIASNTAVVVGQFANTFTAALDANGNVAVTDTTSAQPQVFKGGTLGALLADHNTNIPAYRARLDTLASQVIQRVNQVQATGLGTSGPFSALTSTNAVAADPLTPLVAAEDRPLTQAGALPFPVQAGALTISVTDNSGATPTRTNTTINITATTTLNDLATALSAVPGVQASVNTTTKQLTITANTNFKFDFAGRDTLPAGGGAVANPDTTGVLSALGLNGLFTGSTAAGIGVRQELRDDPGLLAASRTGQPGDGTNLELLGNIRDVQLIGGRTLTQEVADIAATLGTQINALDDQQTTQSNAIRELFTQEQSAIGVDTNEELLRLLDFQRLVEGATKYLSVVNIAMDSILSIID